MLNIKYKGRYRNEEQLKEGLKPTLYTGMYEEIPKLRLILLHYVVPLIVLLIATFISIIYQIVSANNIDLLVDLIAFLNNNQLLLITTVSMILMLYILSFIHELIHCLLYPRQAEKQIYSLLPYSLMVHCGEQISKGMFLMMVLAPSVILGIIPFLLCTMVVWKINPQLSIYFTIVSVSMLASGCSDYINAYKTIVQVPNEAKIFNYGIQTYWIKN